MCLPCRRWVIEKASEDIVSITSTLLKSVQKGGINLKRTGAIHANCVSSEPTGSGPQLEWEVVKGGNGVCKRITRKERK
jgi:hypothetical protein